ncbi:MAG: hypothetical protein AAFX06_26625 [Planctomycetota bacterium]
MNGPGTHVDIIAAEQGKVARFSILAYNGGPLRVGGYDLPVVVNFKTMTFYRNLQLNLDHDTKQRLGTIDAHEVVNNQLWLRGSFNAATKHRDEVLLSAADGFQWEASIEAQPGRLTQVAPGESVAVNGDRHEGPLYVADDAELRGCAIVSHGADRATEVSVAAKSDRPLIPTDNHEAIRLRAWLQSYHIDPDSIAAHHLPRLIEYYYEKRKGELSLASAKSKLALLACQSRASDNQVELEETAREALRCGVNCHYVDLVHEKASNEQWSPSRMKLLLFHGIDSA